MESTLLITCIYANLWGTEFGGRPSREHHYRYSLLNILNLQPNKIICFTSQEEINKLENFFYIDNNISNQLLEFRVFDLKNTKYFDKINSKKDLTERRTSDRCFEIQYNKFLWIYNISDINTYDRVYWIDAGLSHGGLFTENHRYKTNNPDSNNYNVYLFNNTFLLYINHLTIQDKILLISKNNKEFSWSSTLPSLYYNVYNNTRHIIGGLFGGKSAQYINFCHKFEELLNTLLKNENTLYMEELLMSCLYFNNTELYSTLEFDDWAKQPNHTNKNIKYFQDMFLI